MVASVSASLVSSISTPLQNNGHSNSSLPPRVPFSPFLFSPAAPCNSERPKRIGSGGDNTASPFQRLNKREEELFTVQNGSDYISDQKRSPSPSHPRSPGDASSMLTSTLRHLRALMQKKSSLCTMDRPSSRMN
eukprot:GHVN01003329.1.p1 GENE.GHVN01003329.1~~GHVN01003329.1.p1  ORF type:complete len:134 (+),score=8.46 GHVN01003329.1:473-874(+)